MNDVHGSKLTATGASTDSGSWLDRQLDGLVWRPVAVALGLGLIALLLEGVATVVCGGGQRSDCAIGVASGAGGVAFVVVPSAIVVSLIMTSYRSGWSAMRQRALVRVARGLAGVAALLGAAVAAVVGMLFACSGGFLCGDDPVAAAGLFTAAGAALGLAVGCAAPRGRWWLFVLVGAAVGSLPGAAV